MFLTILSIFSYFFFVICALYFFDSFDELYFLNHNKHLLPGWLRWFFRKS